VGFPRSEQIGEVYCPLDGGDNVLEMPLYAKILHGLEATILGAAHI
jgi:hypothetical protein